MNNFYFFIFLGFIHLSPIWAYNDSKNNLSFTPPVVTQGLVSPKWVTQPVKHPPKIGQVDLAVALDQQMYNTLLPHIKAYAKKQDLKIAVIDGTCGISAGMLNRKEVDIGGFCCPPGEMDRLPGLRYHTLGIAAITFFVHSDNPINNITLEEARQVFQGDIRRWFHLSNPVIKNYNRPIKLVTHIHCRLRPGHWRLLLPSEDDFSPDIIDFTAAADLLSFVAEEKNAIGYETLSMQNIYAQAKLLKPISVNNIRPDDLEALAQYRYPLYRVFNLTTWEGKPANPKADALVRYLLDVVNKLDTSLYIAPASLLRQYGWKFYKNELIGEPDHK